MSRRRAIWWWAAWLVGFATVLYLGFWWSLEAMVYFHLMFVDYKDPYGPGLKGMVVSTREFIGWTGVAVALLGMTVACWHRYRKAE